MFGESMLHTISLGEKTNRYNLGDRRNPHDSIRVEITRRFIAEGERAAKDEQIVVTTLACKARRGKRGRSRSK
ncbi:hypothetical protein GB937_001584 [Aspergillus fischeri]|nr:hypothetical protein GB937_001584 [Aspergillus fischeri]